MRISDWSSDVCSSDLVAFGRVEQRLRLFGLGDPRRAIKDEGRADMRFVEQQLRLQQFELEPHRPQVFAQQEIHVLKGEAVRRMLGLGGGNAVLGRFRFLLAPADNAGWNSGARKSTRLNSSH